MVTPRTVLIVNPKSQGGRLGKRWKEMADTIGRAFPFDEAITEAAGDATRLTREALRGGAERAVASARATWSYKNQRVQLVFDGADRVEATISTVAIANGRYFGGAMMVAPNAELDDGMFDVIAMGDFGFGDLLKSGRRLYKGTHLTMDKVTARRARVIEAEPIDPGSVIELDIDGENPGRLPARFEVMPLALWIVAPGAGAAAGERGAKPPTAG